MKNNFIQANPQTCIDAIQMLCANNKRLLRKALLKDERKMSKIFEDSLKDPYGENSKESSLTPGRRETLQFVFTRIKDNNVLMRNELETFCRMYNYRKTICEREFKKFLEFRHKKPEEIFMRESKWVRETFEWGISKGLVKRNDDKNKATRLDYYYICKKEMAND